MPNGIRLEIILEARQDHLPNRIICIPIIEATYTKGIVMEVGHRNQTTDLGHNHRLSKVHLDKNLVVVRTEVVVNNS